MCCKCLKWYQKSNIDPETANYDFAAIAGKGNDFLDPKIPENDFRQLKKQAAAWEVYTDRRISHYDKRDPKKVPAFNDIDLCIDYLEQLLKSIN